MKQFIFRVFVLLLFIPLFSASESQAQRFFGKNKVHGNGHVVTQERDIQADFEGVKVKGSFNVFVTQNKGNFVKVEADENLQEHITTKVKKNQLVISPEKNIYKAKKLNIYVGMEVIKTLAVAGSGDLKAETDITSDELAVTVSGSGDIDLPEVTTDQISISVAGSGDIVIGGQTNDSSISIAGSGDVAAGKLESNDCAVSIAGSGGAKVNVSENLYSQITGSGDVRYSGNPQVSTSIIGSGSVWKK